MRSTIHTLLFFLFVLTANGQVGISEQSFMPDQSAILEIKSTSKGLIIPRMTTDQRIMINSPAPGLLVYDYEFKSFWYYADAQWNEIRFGDISVLSDADQDTEITVEATTDKDEIDFKIKGSTRWTMDSTSLYPRNNGGNILIGNEAGMMSDGQSRATIAIGRRAARNSEDRPGIIAIGDSSLIMNGINGVTGDQAIDNMAIGNKSLKSNTIGKENIAIGSYAMEQSNSGNNNVSVGLSSMNKNDDGSFNVAVGNKSLFENISGAQNTAIGMRSMESNQGGSFNVGVGRQALNGNLDASYNVAIGYNSMQNNTSGEFNTAVGARSLQSNTAHQQSIAIGYEAMKDAQASFQLAIGNNSLMNATSAAFNNTALGHSTLHSTTSGKFNVAIGFESMKSNDTGSDNIGLGYRSLGNTISGKDNLAIGKYALENTSSQDSIIAIGNEAGRSTGTSSSIFLGQNAGKNISTGHRNLFIGHETGNNGGSSEENILVGHNAKTKINGSDNIVIGNDTKGSNRRNTIIGHSAGLISTSSDNVLIGYEAGRDSLTTENVAIGNYAGANVSSGQWNVYVGHKAGMGTGFNNDNVFGNVILGYQAGEDNMDDKNVFIGYQAGQNHQLGNNNVFIGSEAGKDFQGSDRLIIESNRTTSALIMGNFNDQKLGITWGISDAIPHELSVNGEASKTTPGSWLGNSDKRLKTNIEYLDSEEVLDQLMQLRGAQFEWNDAVTGLKRPPGKQTGFIAQDIQQIWPERIKTDPNGYLEASYGDFDPLVVEAIRALNNKVKEQERQIDVLIQQVKDLKELINVETTDKVSNSSSLK
jgi:hypothetical protein